MAPALPEPLSPTEKLSSSAAKASPTNRSNKNLLSSPCLDAKTATNNRKIRNNISVTAPSTSTRITRSRDSYQRIVPSIAATDSSNTVIKKINRKSLFENEQMGLGGEPLNINKNNNNNNNNSINEDLPNSVSNNTEHKEEETTEQLLADITSDFEEAITADLCLRKQFLDAKLGKSDSSINSSKNDPKDIFVIKSGVVAITTDTPTSHMESQRTKENELRSENELKICEDEHAVEELVETEELDKSKVKNEEDNEEPSENKETELEMGVCEEENLVSVNIIEVVEDATPDVVPRTEDRRDSRPKIISVETLPPINTDSTMTASEVEDNIEERLSQLDGSAVLPSSSDLEQITNNVIPTTTSRTLTQTEHQILQRQLQLTPPTPVNPGQSIAPQNQANQQQQQQLTLHTVSGELEEGDLEEVLKALKGLDATNTNSETLSDLNVFLNEVYTTLNCDEMVAQNGGTNSAKTSPLKEIQTDIEKRQQTLQRRTDFLLRRLRKLQARWLCRHTSEEICGVFEWSARVANKGIRNDNMNETQIDANDNNSEASHTLNWEEEKKHPVPAAQITTLLQSLEVSANAQQICKTSTSPPTISLPALSNLPIKKSRKLGLDPIAAVPGTPTATPNERKPDKIVPTLDMAVVDEITHVAGLLQAEMHQVEHAIDSDVTASSSGGESADEMVTYNNVTQKPLSIAKRASYRYACDRAAIAARWSWLQLQIVDLDIKIRHHNDLYKEVVRLKGPVVCDEEVAKKAAQQQSLNGYKDDAVINVDDSEKNDSENEALSGSSRTRGYVPSLFRKRKLFQTANLHTVSKKAARPSSIKCGCQWPSFPCALCTGRSDPTAPRDLPDTMIMSDKVALLDPSYHPVLSFPEDVSASIYFEAIGHLPEWQNRCMRSQVKSIAKGVWKAEKEAASASGFNISRKHNDGTIKRRYIKKKDRLADNMNSSAAVAAKSTNTSGVSIGNETSNDIGNVSTSTTPLVANKWEKKINRLQMEEAIPSQLNNNSNYLKRRTQKNHIDLFKPNPVHSSSISNNRFNNYHKNVTTNSSYHHSAHPSHQPNINIHQYYHPISHQYNTQNSISINEPNLGNTTDNWDNSNATNSYSSRTSSPTVFAIGSKQTNHAKQEKSIERKSRNSYDIDNIVIPYSIAAATRVEVIPYKEIPTPKWRIITNDMETQNKNGDDDYLLFNADNASTNEKSTFDDAAFNDTFNHPNFVTNEAIVNNNVIEKLTLPTDDVDNNMIIDDIKKSEKSEVDSKDKIEIITENGTLDKEVINCSEEMNGNITLAELKEEGKADVLKTTDEEPGSKRRKIEKDTHVGVNDTSVVKVPSKECSSETSNCETMEKAKIEESSITDDSNVSLTNNLSMSDDFLENLSDEAMISRHERALAEERRKFQTFLKFPWSTRSRANRRVDSRAGSSGTNTPDPASPAPQTQGGFGPYQEGIPSPSNISDNIKEELDWPTQSAAARYNMNNRGRERRRTISSKKDREIESRSLSPACPKEIVPPYEPRKFPLSNETYEALCNEMSKKRKNGSYQRSESCQLKSTSRRNRNRTISNKSINIPGRIKMSGNDYNGFKQANQAGHNFNNNNLTKHYISSYDHVNSSNFGLKLEDSNIEEDENDYLDHGGDDSVISSCEEIEEDLEMEMDDEDDDDDDDNNFYHLLSANNDEDILDSDRTISCDSDVDPFQDDDPNDPEWKGERRDRAERVRQKLRKELR